MNFESSTIEDIQLDMVLYAVQQRYGYDFNDYSKSSIGPRINMIIEREELCDVYELIKKLLDDDVFFQKFVSMLTVSVTEMFRDPSFFCSLKENVVPMLGTYPSIKIWIAGCATGEEAYSLAILLHEADLLEKSTIYATDIDKYVLSSAIEGVYPLSMVKKFITNYNKFHGEAHASDYFTTRYDHAIISSMLKNHIVFSQHNLVSDASFASVNLVLCRNVLIYFNRTLQQRAISVINNSLKPLSYMCLGLTETLRCDVNKFDFEVIDSKNKIYRKVKLQRKEGL